MTSTSSGPHGPPKRRLHTFATKIGGICGLGLWMAAMATFANEGAVDYRQHTMEAVGGHTQAVVDIMQQKVPHRAHLALHAKAIADIAAIVDTLFPEGSEGGDALPAIWEEPEGFAERIQAFQTAAPSFRDAVVDGGDIGAAMQALGQSCKGCHDDYREK